MDGRIKSGHDVLVAVEKQEEPGAARPVAMPPTPSCTPRHAQPHPTRPMLFPPSCTPLVMPGLDPGTHCRHRASRPGTHAASRRARRAVGRGGGAGGWPDQVRPWVPGSSPGMTGWGSSGGVGGATGRRSGGRAPRGAARWNLRRAHRRPPAARPNVGTLAMLPHLVMHPRSCATAPHASHALSPSSCTPLVMPGLDPGTHAAYRRARRAVGRRGGGGWPDQVRPWVPGSPPDLIRGPGHDGVGE